MKYYVVQFFTGEYDDSGVSTLFITDKEYKAKFYCSKGNSILKNYTKYYLDMREKIGLSNELTNYSHYSDRVYFTTGSFGYHEIEFRKDIKIK